MADAIAVVNAGSPGLEFSLFATHDSELELKARGQAKGIQAAPSCNSWRLAYAQRGSARSARRFKSARGWRMARLAAPLMHDGGTLFAMSYYGANKVVPNYNVMGPVKAALEACCRYLAYELGGKGIRVHAISPGPLKTRAGSGLKDFELLLNDAAQRAPIGGPVDIMDVGFACAYLATRYARRLSGATVYVDGGVNIMA